MAKSVNPDQTAPAGAFIKAVFLAKERLFPCHICITRELI